MDLALGSPGVQGRPCLCMTFLATLLSLKVYPLRKAWLGTVHTVPASLHAEWGQPCPLTVLGKLSWIKGFLLPTPHPEIC